MSKVLTSNQLIKSIKRRGMIPKNQVTFTDEDFLDMLNEEIDYFGIPHLLSTHEEYLVSFIDVELEDGVLEYEIPERAIGNKLRDVSYIDSDGNSYELSRISLEDVSDYNNTFSVQNFSSVFYVKNNKIVLLDQATTINTSLRMWFYLKPNKLVLEDRAGKIVGINRNTGTITLDSFPDNFFSLPDIDFVQGRSPNLIISYDITPSSINSVTKEITFTTTDIPDLLIVGDYINNAGETIVPQLPTELHAVLCQRVAVAAQEALGDVEKINITQKRLEMMEKATLSLIDNRVEGAPQKIVNRYSTLNEATIGSYINRRKRINR